MRWIWIQKSRNRGCSSVVTLPPDHVVPADRAGDVLVLPGRDRNAEWARQGAPRVVALDVVDDRAAGVTAAGGAFARRALALEIHGLLPGGAFVHAHGPCSSGPATDCVRPCLAPPPHLGRVSSSFKFCQWNLIAAPPPGARP